jgi:arabinose-5-phosphate isomerase
MKQNLIHLAQEFIQIEANAIAEISKQLDTPFNREQFTKAVGLITGCKGKIVFCGMGKSGHICYKLASTFSSIGIPSVFLHPAESVHGDLGLLDEKDVLIFISYSGETAELSIPLKYASRKNIPMIALTGDGQSTLAVYSTVVLTTTISKEACPYNLAPTASTTAALVLGDALGLVSAEQKGYSAERFAEIHPAGSLGLRLTMVKDVMASKDLVATANETDTVKSLIGKMTHGHVRGVAAVLNPTGNLIGAVTDGDIRRLLERDQVDLNAPVSTLMSKTPKVIAPTSLVEQAVTIMEEFKIQSLFVVDESKKLLGLVHVQDVLKAKTR